MFSRRAAVGLGLSLGQVDRFFRDHDLAPDAELSLEGLERLLRGSTPGQKGWAAYNLPEPFLSRETRLLLAYEADPWWKGQIAFGRADLPLEDRIALARESRPCWKSLIALCPDFPGDFRQSLKQGKSNDSENGQ